MRRRGIGWRGVAAALAICVAAPASGIERVRAGAPPFGASGAAHGAELEAALAELAAQLGDASVRAISPGTLWQQDPAVYPPAFDVASGFLYRPGALEGSCAYAPLRFADGETITGVVVLYVDNSPSGDFVVELKRKNTALFAGAEVLASASSSGASGTHQIATDLSVANGTVDNSVYAYFLWVCLPIDYSELHGIYLTYEG